jgi:hypothetical protein
MTLFSASTDGSDEGLRSRRQVLVAAGIGAGLLAGAVLAPETAAAAPRESAALRLLTQPPFPPRDVNLLTPGAYPAGSPTVPAAPYRVTEQRARAELLVLLARRRGNVPAGCRLFESAQLKALAPDPRVRAAIASLSGTPAEGSIRAFTGGAYRRVEIGPIPADINQTVSAVNYRRGDDPLNTVTVNEKYGYEPLGLLSVLMAHEPLHLDGLLTNKEELIISAVDSAMYARSVVDGSVDAGRGTELTRKMNVKVMALVNTRDAGGHIRLRVSQGNVYPGAASPLDNFAAAYPGYDTAAATPGSSYLSAVLHDLLGIGGAHDFDDTTLGLVDAQVGRALPPDGWVAVANKLRLKLS